MRSTFVWRRRREDDEMSAETLSRQRIVVVFVCLCVSLSVLLPCTLCRVYPYKGLRFSYISKGVVLSVHFPPSPATFLFHFGLFSFTFFGALCFIFYFPSNCFICSVNEERLHPSSAPPSRDARLYYDDFSWTHFSYVVVFLLSLSLLPFVIFMILFPPLTLAQLLIRSGFCDCGLLLLFAFFVCFHVLLL